jgi:hypothetical protein
MQYEMVLYIVGESITVFHKVFSMSSIIAGIVHGIYNPIPSSATEVYQSTILFSGVSLLVLMSLQRIMHVFLKRYWFKGFYYCHILVYIVMTYDAVQHKASLILFSTIIWTVDMIVRYILTSRKVMIHIKNVTSDHHSEYR